MKEVYDFDRIIDRSDTGSVKWEKYRGRDILPYQTLREITRLTKTPL